MWKRFGVLRNVDVLSKVVTVLLYGTSTSHELMTYIRLIYIIDITYHITVCASCHTFHHPGGVSMRFKSPAPFSDPREPKVGSQNFDWPKVRHFATENVL